MYTSILGSVLGNSGVTATCSLPGRPHMEGNIHNTSSGIFAVLSPQSCEGSPPDLGLVSLLLLETQEKIWYQGIFLMIKSGKDIFSSFSESLLRKKKVYFQICQR